MQDVMKAGITILACVTAMAMIGFGLFGFVNDLKMWGAPIMIGCIIGGLSMTAAYSEF